MVSIMHLEENEGRTNTDVLSKGYTLLKTDILDAIGSDLKNLGWKVSAEPAMTNVMFNGGV